VIGTSKSDSADVEDLINDTLREPKNVGTGGLLKPGYQVIDQVARE
jgi:hypothetical protein